MADSKLSALPALVAANLASGDLFLVDDVSATTSKSITANEVATAISTLLGLGALALKSTVVSSDITDGTIVNADVSASAAIALSKLATDPLARANHTGSQLMATISDAGTLATLSAVGSSQITDGSVANVDLANMVQSTIKGRAAAAGTGAPVDLTPTQVRTLVDTNTTPSTQAVADAAAVGTADTLARGDHKHAMPTAADLYALAASLNAQTTDYTLVLADAGKIVEANKASAIAITVPTNASVAFPVGTLINLAQVGAGAATVVAAGGVTIEVRSPLTLVMKGQWATAQLYKRATNEWVLSGDLT